MSDELKPDSLPASELLLTAAEMRGAEAGAIHRAGESFALMKAAGLAVAGILARDYALRRAAIILCGPGNNGGDGFIAAERLRRAGWSIDLLCDRPPEAYRGDAAKAALAWQGKSDRLSVDNLQAAFRRHPRALILDAIFGIGLDRDLGAEHGAVLAAIAAANAASGRPVIAIDMPSGIDADSGAIRGFALRADRTLTFGWAKIGHALAPGSDHAGRLEILPLSFLPEDAAASGARLWRNTPALWQGRLPRPLARDHKYSRGLGLILARGEMFGAALLAAEAARRIGAGMIILGAPSSRHGIALAAAPGLVLKAMEGAKDVAALLAPARHRAVLIGCGCPPDAETRAMILAALAGDRPVIVDGGGLSAFAGAPDRLFAALRPDCVLLPHDGEFAALFPDLATQPDRLKATRLAAERAGALLLRKGHIAILAAADGCAIIAPPAPADLATAGSGDVLAGLLLGLMAQGMPSLRALAAAIFYHAEAARHCGPGLIAEDLPKALPIVAFGNEER